MKQKHIFNHRALSFMIILFLIFLPTIIYAQGGSQLVVHYIEGQPLQEKVGYQVSVYLSALKADGSAISDLTRDDFIITEDSKQVEIDGVESSSDLPINLILLIDSSGSMQGTPIQDARNAASNFIGELDDEDRLALAAFNEQLEYLADFSDDLNTARGKVTTINAVNLASTCLYDAAFSAVEKAATLESGRRAIILLTDGQDYKSGGACSVHTLDDVIDMASAGSTRVPVYTIGLGTEIDEKNLQRLSDMSGGVYQYAPSSSKLQDTFNALSSQLRSQYVLTYTSSAAPGSHTVAVEMKYDQQTVQDTRNFTLPELPIVLTLVSPSDGQDISGSVKFAASISGSGETVEKIVYLLGDQEILADTTTPYDLNYEFSEEQLGSHVLTAQALNAGGEVIAQDSLGINVLTAADTDKQEIETPESISAFLDNPLYIGLAVLGLAILAFALVLIIRRRKKKEPVFTDEFILREEPRAGDDRTVDIQLLSTKPKPGAPAKAPREALAVLTIINSDDTGMIDQQLSITRFPTTVGRSAKNDIVISKKDQPVSRNHIIIDRRGEKVVLMEVVTTDESGNMHTPTYGTFVNEKKVSAENTPLKDGDEIRLGSRFRMRFDTVVRQADGSEERTMDGIDLSAGSEKTREIKRGAGDIAENGKE